MIKGFISRCRRYLSRLYHTARSDSAPDGELGWPHVVVTTKFWKRALTETKKGDVVLIATTVSGFHAGVLVESLLGIALTLRGARVHYLICDAQMPTCLQVHQGKIESVDIVTDYRMKDKVCPGCIKRGAKLLDPLGLPIIRYSDHLSSSRARELRDLAHRIDLNEIPDYVHHGVNVGQHALSGTLRFFSRGHLPPTPEGEAVLRRYFEAALITQEVTQSVINVLQPKVAVYNHGIYVPHGVISDVARSNAIRVVTWNVAYKSKCFIFSHDDTYHHTLIEEPTSVWENISLDGKLDKELDAYLKSRWYGTSDWIWFHDQPQHSLKAIEDEIGIDFTKPVVAALTNVFWDAQLHYKANAFKDMLEWLQATIAYFGTRTDLQLAIRIHPAEVRGAIPSKQPLVEEIRKLFPELPANVFIIPPESQASTYSLCEGSNAVIIYGTKTGVEMTAKGIPVIVAGEAWIRNKGLTLDADTPENYLRLLEKLPLDSRMNEAQVSRARKYAYHFFFRRFIPMDFVNEDKASPPYKIEPPTAETLLPGGDIGLDVICDGILRRTPFIYPAEVQ
ncbi:capsule biosynthesis protein [Rhizobium leguminosarum]|uniref:capsule biosynthesis protein n=1 Tax=Rhizobium TaxID=379 RepID=UPI001FDF5EBE|nr:capsule biosynthesis protein [Rhizobium leguminosarum]